MITRRGEGFARTKPESGRLTAVSRWLRMGSDGGLAGVLPVVRELTPQSSRCSASTGDDVSRVGRGDSRVELLRARRCLRTRR